MSVGDLFATTAEQRLLLAAARAAIEPEAGPELRRLIGRGVDWQRLTACARENKLLPLVYRALSAEARELVPAGELAELRRRYLANAQRNLRLTAELARLLRRLAADGIPALPVKGPMLARRLYGDVARREYFDLDLVVAPADFLAALGRVESLGYRLVEPAVTLTPGQRAALFRYRIGRHLWLREPATGTDLELHSALAPGDRFFRVAGREFWQGLATAELAGAPVADLGTEDLLLYLCVHGSKDRWQRLSFVCDLALALRRYGEVDWAPLLARAESWRGVRQVLLGPYLAQRLLGAPLPPPLAERVRAEAPALAALARRSSLFRERTPWQRVRYQIALREGALARLGTLAHAVMAPQCSTIESVRLPPRLFALYFLVRPVQLVAGFAVRAPLERLFGPGPARALERADPGRSPRGEV